MSEKKFTKGSEEWQLFMDYWALCQKFWEPEENDAYWELVIGETDAFCKKYNTEFARSLALTLVKDIERRNLHNREGNQ